LAFARISRRANRPDRLRTIAQSQQQPLRIAPDNFDIPFAELGEFVYHRHILEHEDGGMMARVKVVPAAF